MKRLTILALAGAAALGVVAAHAADKPKKQKGTLEASRAGWLMGMYVGEDKNNFYPFVIQVDKDGDAFAKGVREGDEIIRFDGQETSPIQRLFRNADSIYPGHEVTMWVRRGVETYHFDFRMPKEAHLSPEQRQAKEAEADKKSKKNDKKQAKSDKNDKSGTDENGDDKGKKKDPKKGPIVIKPIPAPDGN